ncbi:MAG: hypothetical protein IJ362_05565 [Oscillospiraceae bacterium]|nr:hypothetical protein [Oscillospiraceae bacterium]
MKKIISMIIALAVVLSLTACGGGAQSSSTADSQSEPRPSPTPKVLSDTPALSYYDRDTGRYINDYTGLELTLPECCSIIDIELVYTDYYNSGHTTEEIKAMTSRQLAELDRFTDYFVWDKSNSNYMMVTVENLENYRKPDEYLEILFAPMEDVYEEGTVMLSGVEYNYKTGTVNGKPTFAYWLMREDGHIVQILYFPENMTSPEYLHAMFNGGVKLQPDEENVPDLFEYDSSLDRLKNLSAGVEIDLPDMWIFADRDSMAQAYYGMSGRELDGLTKAQLAQNPVIYDMHITDPLSDDFIEVRYLSRRNWESYDLPVDRMLEQMVAFYDDSNQSRTICDKVEVGGYTYSTLDTYFYKEETNVYRLYRELNEDYVVQIIFQTVHDTPLYEFLDVLNSNNDVDMLLQRSEYDEKQQLYHNRSTDVTIKVPSHWYRIDQKMLDWLYKGKLTTDMLGDWTETDYMTASIVPDFAVAHSENSAYMLVYYANLNKVSSAGKMDINEYYQWFVKDRENKGYIINEKDIAYELGGHVYMMLDADAGDGSEKRQVAITDIGDDYAAVINYHIIEPDKPYSDLMAFLLTD